MHTYRKHFYYRAVLLSVLTAGVVIVAAEGQAAERSSALPQSFDLKKELTRFGDRDGRPFTGVDGEAYFSLITINGNGKYALNVPHSGYYVVMSDSRESSVNALTGPEGIGSHSTLLPFGYTMIEEKSGSNPLRKLVDAAAGDPGKVLKIVVGVYRASTGKQLYTFTMSNVVVVPDSTHLAHGWFSFAIANSQVAGKASTVSATGNLKIPGVGTVGSTM